MNAPIDDLGTYRSRGRQGYQKIRSDADWVDFVGPDWLASIMTVEVRDRFHAKQGRSIGRWTLTAADGRTLVVYLKRHFVLPAMDAFRARLFPRRAHSPGLQEYEHLEWARQQGIRVPRVAAAAEFLLPDGRLQSFIALEELTNQLPLHEAVPLAAERLSPSDFQRWKDLLSTELVRLSHEFHTKHTYHRDWYFCHFYIDEADTKHVPTTWQDRVTTIDLHRMIQPRWLRLWKQAKDIAQLWYSSDVPGVTDADRQRFWQAYRPHGWRAKLLGWLIKMKWKLYQRHNAPKG